MSTLTFLSEDYEAERIVKTSDSIIGYIGNSEVFSFRGVTDFSLFQINGEWDEPEPSTEDTLGTLLIESAADKATIAALEDTVGSLLLEVAALKGGGA